MHVMFRNMVLVKHRPFQKKYVGNRQPRKFALNQSKYLLTCRLVYFLRGQAAEAFLFSAPRLARALHKRRRRHEYGKAYLKL